LKEGENRLEIVKATIEIFSTPSSRPYNIMGPARRKNQKILLTFSCQLFVSKTTKSYCFFFSTKGRGISRLA